MLIRIKSLKINYSSSG